MGCYNGEGCISGLPIECGDRIGGLICKATRGYDGSEIITPVWPIIWGEYDDYGGIAPDAVDEELEKFFGNRENLMRDLERITHGCRDQVEPGLPNELCLLLEHEEVLRTLVVEGKPGEARENYMNGDPMYALKRPSDVGSWKNIYNASWCYADNSKFLAAFRLHFNNTLPDDRQKQYFEITALYEALHRNSIFLRWQRFAGWQYPSRRSDLWKKLTTIYHTLTVHK